MRYRILIVSAPKQGPYVFETPIYMSLGGVTVLWLTDEEHLLREAAFVPKRSIRALVKALYIDTGILEQIDHA